MNDFTGGGGHPDTADTRNTIVRRFETWLDGVLADESAPEGIDAAVLAELADGAEDASGGTDAFALWSALTALTQEVKLQSRAFQMLSERLDPLADAAARLETVAEGEQALARAVAQLEVEVIRRQQRWEKELRQECERRAIRQILETLVDIHERLLRGAEVLEGAAPDAPPVPGGFWSRLAGGRGGGTAREILKAHETGNRLLLERVEAALASHGVRRRPCAGRPFDPALMVALAVEERAGAEDGTVLEELRGGYEWNGEVFRTAEVTVARRSA